MVAFLSIHEKKEKPHTQRELCEWVCVDVVNLCQFIFLFVSPLIFANRATTKRRKKNQKAFSSPVFCISYVTRFRNKEINNEKQQHPESARKKNYENYV